MSRFSLKNFGDGGRHLDIFKKKCQNVILTSPVYLRNVISLDPSGTTGVASGGSVPRPFSLK